MSAEHVDFWQSLASDNITQRSITQFAEQEIIIPNGPFSGQYFNVQTQPFVRLYFGAIESRKYQRFAVVGPTQSGKTLCASVIPTLYQLFECADDVVFGAPTIDLAKDKWTKDFAPVIRHTRYAHLMPTKGTGARGGTPTGINFLNGASLRFMTGGSSDKGVAGYTARVIAITEVDGMDDAMSTSREADRISQLEVRGDAFGLSKRVYLECTASIPDGRIWREYKEGSHCVIEKPCPYCGAWVTPEREHIRGWRDCASERAVVDAAYFVCPACDHPLTATDRVDMNHACRARVDNHDSLTFSFSWNAFDNLFWTPGEVGLDEWRAAHRPEHERDNAEKVQHQFKWAMPYESKIDDLEEVIELNLADAVYVYKRGVVPEWADILTFGADVHAKLLYWSLVAWKLDGTCHVADYGKIENPHKDHGQEEAVRLGLVDLNTLAQTSWPQNNKSQPKKLNGGLVDARWLPDVVVGVVAPPLFPVQGFSAFANFKKFRGRYSKPKLTNDIVKQIGDGWHKERRKTEKGTRYVGFVVDSDDAKSFVHRRLATPQGQPGAMTFFQNTEPDGHKEFLDHLTSERQVLKKGIIIWVEAVDPVTGQKRTQNHWLDCMGYAAMAARAAGVKVVTQATQISPPKSSPKTDNAPATQPRLRSRY
jgi:phage terminase large subunit GpA-like protein